MNRRVLFIDGTEGHNPKKTKEKPSGGILTSLTYIPEYLAKKGWDVWVQSKYEQDEVVNGVHYVKPDQIIPKWDVIVFNRNVLPKDYVMWNKEHDVKIVWWLHDIVDTRYLLDDAFKYVDHIVALSDYCKETYSTFYEIRPDKFTTISNGVDPELWYPGNYEDRNPNLFMMASALIKGIVPVDTTYVTLFRHLPHLDFRIYSSQALHGFSNSPDQHFFLEKMRKAGANIYQPVSQDVLAHIMRKAWCLIMPNSYPEICSNLLLQARACGLPVVTSNIGANPEFVGPNLMTTQYYPHDIYSWIVEFANKTLSLSLNKDLHKKISEESPIGVPTWEGTGEKWFTLLEKLTTSNKTVAEV